MASSEPQAPQGAEVKEPENEAAPNENSIQGQAVRSLISMLVDEPNVAKINEHQASTLRKLALLRSRLSNLNSEMADQYTTSSIEYQRATRLASQIKSDLNDISLRLSNIKKKLNILNSPPPLPTTRRAASPGPPMS